MVKIYKWGVVYWVIIATAYSYLLYRDISKDVHIGLFIFDIVAFLSLSMWASYLIFGDNE